MRHGDRTDIELPPTPTDPDGRLLVGPPTAQTRTAEARALTPAPVRSPTPGPARRIDGVVCRPFTFALAPQAGADRAALHLTSWSDTAPGDSPPLPLHVVGAGGAGLTVTLPEDGIWSYRYVTRGARDDARAMRPDPLNPHRLQHPRLGPSSVLVGPAASTHPAWERRSPVVVDREEHLLRLPDRRVRLLRDPRDAPGAGPTGRGAPVCVVFDEAAWTRIGLAGALGRYTPVVHVALVDTLDQQRRARDLTRLERAQVLLAGVIDVVGARLDRRLTAADVIVAGQSYGGLAAASLAVCRPDLAGAAITQSASFWHRRGMTPGMPRTEPGDLVEFLRGRSGALGMTGLCGRAEPGSIVVQTGTDERDQVRHARAFREAARGAGLPVRYREYRGGHDYAWWAHGLLQGLDALLGENDRARRHAR